MADQGNKKHIAFMAVSVVLAVLIVAGYLVLSKGGAKRIITPGDKAPDFQLMTAQARLVKLSDLKGKVVMVHFWATWCPPCVEELPTLTRLHQRMLGTDFVLLAISVDEGAPGDVINFMQKNKAAVPLLFDQRKETAASYGTFKFPETYIVDREGIVRHKTIGARNWDDPQSIKIVQDLLQKR